MPPTNPDLTRRIKAAVRHFWRTRKRQSRRQGATTGERDRGTRSAVTGGAHLDGFADLIQELVVEAGIPDSAVYRSRRVELPGYFRAEKKWDLVIVVDGHLLAAAEFKSHIGPSFGNNFNNRSEEALGNATDLWAAFREGAYRGALRPWLGYLMLVEEAVASTQPVDVAEPHFPVFDDFRGASYVRRYEILLTRLVRERLYDGASLLLSPQGAAQTGDYLEPLGELSFANFAESLVARAMAHVRTRSH